MPIKHSDPIIPEENPFQNCKLGREKYAKILTTVVESFPEGLVMAINNSWGAGKTVFVKMWAQKLKNEGFEIIHFNAWENDFDNNPLTAILAELKLLLPLGNDNKFNGLLKKASVFAKELVPAITKQLLKKHAGEEFSDSIEAASKASVDILKEEIDDFTSKQKGIKEFRLSLEKYLHETSSGKPLVFIIDELDRCRPDYSVEFLEKIKHFFNVSGIVFVLSIDKIQLGNAIKGFYGSEMEAPIKLTTSGRGKLTTCFAGEDLYVQVC